MSSDDKDSQDQMEEEEEEDLAFHEMGLDDRILKAVAKCGWSQPTAIQEKAIPLILEGKNQISDMIDHTKVNGQAETVPLPMKIMPVFES